MEALMVYLHKSALVGTLSAALLFPLAAMATDTIDLGTSTSGFFDITCGKGLCNIQTLAGPIGGSASFDNGPAGSYTLGPINATFGPEAAGLFMISSQSAGDVLQFKDGSSSLSAKVTLSLLSNGGTVTGSVTPTQSSGPVAKAFQVGTPYTMTLTLRGPGVNVIRLGAQLPTNPSASADILSGTITGGGQVCTKMTITICKETGQPPLPGQDP
jgi:hypothetical protein